MWHNVDMSHVNYVVRIGERGRLVVPAAVREELELEEGSQLVLSVVDHELRLEKARDIVMAGRGMFADRSGRNLVDELLEERRAEAAREAETLEPH